MQTESSLSRVTYILVGMLKKERRKATDALSRLQGAPLARTTSSNGAECGSCGRPPTGNMAAILRSNKSDVGTSPDTMNTNSSNVYQSNIREYSQYPHYLRCEHWRDDCILRK